MTTHYLDLERVRLRYRVEGDPEAPPVVLLHGGGFDEAELSWRHAIPALSENARVYAPDLPGYGASGPPAETPTLAYYAGVLSRFLDEVGVADPALVGISMGGGVALRYAVDDPTGVSRLAIVDSYGLGTSVPASRLAYWFTRADRLNRLVWRAMARSRRLTGAAVDAVTVSPGPALVDDAVASLDRPNPGAAWRDFQRHEVCPSGLRTAFVDDLPDLSVPTLLVHGERDPLVPVDWAVRAAALLPDATLRVLSNCGHMPPRERPDAFNERVRSFLETA
ncbi:alpha/beta fold hydrolase [Haloarchaeobius sp. HRN-SO-5]|uniref:alpha/beta fold hydrolase n=1 Tax=Haloarchaeobius sp. HRN-SO-5 TaxID=3446118 RepID=UPI003EB816A2